MTLDQLHFKLAEPSVSMVFKRISVAVEQVYLLVEPKLIIIPKDGGDTFLGSQEASCHATSARILFDEHDQSFTSLAQHL